MSDQRYGPNTAQVERLIARVGKLDLSMTRALADAWDAACCSEMEKATHLVLAVVWSITESPGDEARAAAVTAAGGAAATSAPFAHLESACEALWHGGAALAVRDLLPSQDFETVTAPVASVLGRCWEEDA